MYNIVMEREQNRIGKRIAAARKKKKMTVPELCNKLKDYGLDITWIGVGKWERGETMPNAYQLLAVSFALEVENGFQYFSGTDTTLPVLNELGMQKLEDYKSDLIASGKYRPYSPPENKCTIIEMPVCRLHASAGTGSFLDEGGYDMISVISSQVPPGTDFGIYISGDSMEPYYHDGNIAWVHECKELSPGEVGIFTYEGDGYIKQYDEQEPDEDIREAFTDSDGAVHMQPILRSFNSVYSPKFIYPESYFEIVGKVLN